MAGRTAGASVERSGGLAASNERASRWLRSDGVVRPRADRDHTAVVNLHVAIAPTRADRRAAVDGKRGAGDENGALSAQNFVVYFRRSARKWPWRDQQLPVFFADRNSFENPQA